MEKIHAEELIAELIQMGGGLPQPFPYAGCRFVLEGVEDEFKGFIPDLDLWSMNIAGYCSWGARILRWPQEKLMDARGRMALGFFEEHPEYRRLQRFIARSDAPDLYEYLSAYERARRKLLEVFSCLLEGNQSRSV